jgi:hypothetical protein
MTCTIEGNNSVGSLLKPLLKKVTPVVGSRMLWSLDIFLTQHRREREYTEMEIRSSEFHWCMFEFFNFFSGTGDE